MKEAYTEAELEVVTFEASDVITTSYDPNEGPRA